MTNKMKKLVLLGLLFTVTWVGAQEITADSLIVENIPEIRDTVITPFKKFKVDGVAALVGEYVVLESDIDKAFIDLKNQGVSTTDVSRCQLLGKLMEDKLYAHQAVQDSIEVSDAEVESTVERQIDYLVQQTDGSMEKLLKFYKKDSEESFRKELFEINKVRMLSERMQQKIVEEIEITPEEVRQFFDGIPENQRPLFGAELEIAQIVKKPKPSEEENQRIINKLNRIRNDVLENGISFKTKAILHSQDEASRPSGGFYKMNKKTPFVKEFKDVAFSLQEGEISEPFETIFGWHIIYLEKIRGQEIDVRHILLIPEVSETAREEAKKELETIRQRILDEELTFADAARAFSDEKETKFDGGQLRNPTNFDTRFELTKMDPTLYSQVRNLKDNEISMPIMDEDRSGAIKYKILRVTNRYDEHIADYAQDYTRIQDLALKQKQLKAIEKWMKEKINEAYIYVSTDNRSCDFANNWLKK